MENQVITAGDAFVNALKKVRNLTSNTENLLRDLGNGNARLTTHAFKSIVPGGGQNQVKLFLSATSKDLRINNIAQGKTTSKQLMLVTRIVLQAKQITVAANEKWEDKAADTVFKNISALPGGIENGFMTIRSGPNTYLQDFPLSAFTVDAQPNGKITGEISLKSVCLIEPDAEISVELDFGVPTPANTYFKIELGGPCTIGS